MSYVDRICEDDSKPEKGLSCIQNVQDFWIDPFGLLECLLECIDINVSHQIKTPFLLLLNMSPLIYHNMAPGRPFSKSALLFLYHSLLFSLCASPLLHKFMQKKKKREKKSNPANFVPLSTSPPLAVVPASSSFPSRCTTSL